ncbi:hypothetical protein LB542_21825 [Mesorhizobium sp. BR1-1-9]|uniref:hypothetical protein n=1 Tax=Mesorhizobium sp. BR1-1-9 TaxID=2876646 RepID=UPI001CD0483B|nr:hypothetical protein [Mesorhizobium sp. BR1-1-9]MBZ9873474.1 hypothetical protein [Mesorhizobium sp. BR1-1-9]
MPLIALDNGDTLNCDHVVKFTTLHDGRYQFGMTDGSMHCGHVDNPEEAFFPLVPAAPGFRTIVTDVVDGERTWEVHAVVAWRICPSGNFAISEGMRIDDSYAALIEPDGSVIDFNGYQYDNFDEYRLSIVQEDTALLRAA